MLESTVFFFVAQLVRRAWSDFKGAWGVLGHLYMYNQLNAAL